MKKHLLLMAGLLFAFCEVGAQFITTPTSYNNLCYTAMSPNGKFIAGSDPYTGSVSVRNMETNTNKKYNVKDAETEWYELGTGTNSISNDGIVLICTSYNGTSAYIENGQIKFLPLPDGTTSAYCNAITPDGSRIAGNIGVQMTMNTEDVMQRPVIWNRQEDGTYGMPVELPYPKKDISGRVPQYILVDGISADGKTLACNLVDYSGMLCQPMLMKENEAGEWAYTFIADDYVNPENLEYPEYPGEAPDVTLYMSEEELAAYNQALDDANHLVQPMPIDFMTPENRAAYELAIQGYTIVYYTDYMSDEDYMRYIEALDAYYKALYPKPGDYITGENLERYLVDYNAWNERFDAFTNVWKQMFDSAVEFQMNALTLSPNGRYYAIAGRKTDESEMKAFVFDTETGKAVAKGVDGIELFAPTYIADDGRMLAAKTPTRADQTAFAYFSSGLEAPFLPLQDVVKDHDATTYNWMKQKMVHKITVWDEEEEEDVTKNIWITGVPCCDVNMQTIVTWALDSWSSSLSSSLYSYALSTPYLAEASTSIEAAPAVADNASPSAPAIYNLAGQKVSPNYRGIIICNGKKVCQ